jgi:hypothetical protein
MPLSLTRFGQGRLSSTSGTSPASISPPSTPAPSSASYIRKPYLGWRSQERLNLHNGTTTGASGTSVSSTSSTGGPRLSTYRPPAERMAAEVLTMRQKTGTHPHRGPTGADRPPLPKPPPRSEKMSLSHLQQTPRRPHTHATPSDPRPPSPSVHDSIREVTDAINQFVTAGEQPRPVPRQKHANKGSAIWFESSFVGRKPE